MGRYYIGHTGEPIAGCLRKHLSNHSGYTSKAKDWVLKYAEEHPSKKEAYANELEIKRKKSIKIYSKSYQLSWIEHPHF